VIAGGGGGVPVVKGNGLKGVEAVIDKDLTASLLAIALRAANFIILTDVPNVFTGFGTSSQRPMERMNIDVARELLERGEFPLGSMGPKVEAALNYVHETGRRVLITDLEHLEEALKEDAGTWVET
jgi:carbamate kinase